MINPDAKVQLYFNFTIFAKHKKVCTMKEKKKKAIQQLEELAAECEKSGLAIVADRIRKIIGTLKDW